MAHESLFHYHRCGRLLRPDMRGISELEMRQLILGMWSRLSPEERRAYVEDLRFFQQDTEAFLSTQASAVARALVGDQTMNLDAVAPMFRAELPGVR